MVASGLEDQKLSTRAIGYCSLSASHSLNSLSLIPIRLANILQSLPARELKIDYMSTVDHGIHRLTLVYLPSIFSLLSSLMMIIFNVGSKSLTGVSPGNLRIEHMLALFVYLALSLDADVVVLRGDEVRRWLTKEKSELTLSMSERLVNRVLRWSRMSLICVGAG